MLECCEDLRLFWSSGTREFHHFLSLQLFCYSQPGSCHYALASRPASLSPFPLSVESSSVLCWTAREDVKLLGRHGSRFKRAPSAFSSNTSVLSTEDGTLCAVCYPQGHLPVPVHHERWSWLEHYRQSGCEEGI